ncbi:LacI family DNA-binding transcriptional regulator [Streptomyces oryzae]|uniref:LacI family DNA-binding transcriptional regulator n=1 Tax=Streptomyces oryzae TaxID=1434886 RepID=A0ABS3XEQ0_9ACTN|nr:LacI family DNA-binding transcriptional regulator [Streptomyces oryzae]MBO8193872.1 LacI family DNA-binding transcriptional regulator [Streptomyces oryzae]
MAPTLTDVAKHAGVALSTASRAFSEPDRLGPETLRKVVEAARELGYEAPHGRAAGAVTADEAQDTVAVIVPDVANPVFGSFVKSAQHEGWHRQLAVVLADTDFDPGHERELLAHLRHRAAGLVVCSPRLEADEVIGLAGDTPLVLVNRETDRAHCVLADAADGLRQTVEYLAALGHRKLAYVQGSSRSWSNAHRVGLAQELTARAGLELDVLGRQSETVAGGNAAAAGVVASGATAVLAHNDLVAMGIVAGARALGVRVPEDLSVVGFDDIPFAEVSHPALTSISVPMARAAASALKRISTALSGAGGPRADTLRLATQLHVRGSTGPVPARTAQLARP